MKVKHTKRSLESVFKYYFGIFIVTIVNVCVCISDACSDTHSWAKKEYFYCFY